MTEAAHHPFDDLLPALLAGASTEHPRRCPSCERTWSSFQSYASTTTPIGGTCFPPELGLPILLLANCACGSTLSMRLGPTDAEAFDQFRLRLSATSRRTGLPATSLVRLLDEHLRRLATA